MSVDFPLVVFTLLSQLAVGISFFVCWNSYRLNAAERAPTMHKAWFWAFAFSLIGIIASLFHLGHPFQAFKALYNLGGSWLSVEGAVFACFCGLSFICIFWRPRWFEILTALFGCFGLVAQGLTYSPPSMPAINNAFPMALFFFSAIAMGACCEGIMRPKARNVLTRPFVLILIILLLTAPVVWITGGGAMGASGHDWLASFLFWLGIAFLLAAFIIACARKTHGGWELATLVCGLLLTRMVFFADVVHTASRLGLPYN